LDGKDCNISYLLNKENIASRIDIGLSYAEFSYKLLYYKHLIFINYIKIMVVQFKLAEVINGETLLLERIIFINKLEMII
jgi:hypothetical protein